MVYPIPNYTRVWVRGNVIDVLKAAREEAAYGVTGPVQFIPQIKRGINPALRQMLHFRPFVAHPDPTTGYFEIQLPSTNDPDITPVDFSYEAILPDGTRFLMKVPYDTPILWDPEDIRHEEPVLELAGVMPDPDNPGGFVQLLVGQPGRSIDWVDIDEDYHLVGEYDDGMPFDAGQVPGVYTVNGHEGPDVTLVKADVGLGNADNTSDVNKPVSTATQTALDGKANSSHTHTAAQTASGTFAIARIPTGTSGTTVALGNHGHGISGVTGLQAALDAKPDSSDIDNIVVVTQAAYDLLTPDARTLYVVVG